MGNIQISGHLEHSITVWRKQHKMSPRQSSCCLIALADDDVIGLSVQSVFLLQKVALGFISLRIVFNANVQQVSKCMMSSS